MVRRLPLTTQSLVVKPIAVALVVVGATVAAQAQDVTSLPVVQVTAPTANGRWPDSLRRKMRDSLDAARARWERNRPRVYAVAMVEVVSMVRVEVPPEYARRWYVQEVHGDSAVGDWWWRDDSAANESGFSTMTIDAAFKQLDRELRDSTRQIRTLRFNDRFGYPTEWRTDDSQNGWGSGGVSDQGGGRSVAWFSDNPRDWKCHGMRRLLPRCW
jgi:hypothetical protein